MLTVYEITYLIATRAAGKSGTLMTLKIACAIPLLFA